MAGQCHTVWWKSGKQMPRDAIAITKLSTPDDKIYGVGIDPQLIRLAPFVWQNGGDIVDNPARPTRLARPIPPSCPT